MDNKKVEIRETEKYGRAVFAKEDIQKEEIIASFDGPVYEAERAMLLPNDPPLCAGRHSVQFEERKYRDSNGIARYMAHSCDPNCGIKNLFDVVAMRDIKKDEEIVWDYEMTEKSDFRMECMCGSSICRGIIGTYANMPEQVKEKYKGYISEWLTKSD
jgi:SET domain-containing protein